VALGVKYFGEEREKRRGTWVFGRYVARDVVDEVLSAPESALATLEGASRPLSVLFADLRGFPAASEGADPQDVVRALNAYLDAMVQAVNEERGTIDKFMGDCVMAFWGAPRPTERHAQRAVRAGIGMLDYIDRAVASGETAGLNVSGCGVGVATGPAVVGNIGATDRLDYTVIGDTVNTASRLCGVAGAGQVVVTEACAAELGDGFWLGDLPPLAVKGKALSLRVYQVLREGQEPAHFEDDALLEATEDKGHFEVPRTQAAGYAPIEPAAQPADEPRPAG
jgi:adenylate cyclase